MRIRLRCFRHCYCHGSAISCQWNSTKTSIHYFMMLGWWRECRKRMPYVFHVRISQRTIGAVVPVAWPLWVQVQVKMHMAMALPKVFLVGKDYIATQWLWSLLDRLDNGTDHRQTFQNWQTPTAKCCQSKNAAGVVVDQVTMEQTLYV